jgi:hypothetical protein
MHRDRAGFIRWIRDRFLLRFHMTFILLGTFVAGLVTTKVLLEVQQNVLWLRYLIAVAVAYLAFLGLVRLWLAYLAWCARGERDAVGPDGVLDLVDGMCEAGELFSSSVSPSAEPVQGGEFGGAGSSGSWNAGDVNVSSATETGSAAGNAASGCGFDLDEAVWILVVAAAVLAVFLAGIYLVWIAPAMLAEAAFEAALASTLVRRAKKVESAGWIRSVVRATVWPFIIILLFSVVAGWAAQRNCPDATRLVDAIVCDEP